LRDPVYNRRGDGKVEMRKTMRAVVPYLPVVVVALSGSG